MCLCSSEEATGQDALRRTTETREGSPRFISTTKGIPQLGVHAVTYIRIFLWKRDLSQFVNSTAEPHVGLISKVSVK